MEIIKILITGIIDGLTGFLPVSSSGHLAILRNKFGFGVADSILFDICLKLAAFIVIFFVMKKDVIKVLKAGKRVIKAGFANVLLFFANIGKFEKDEYYSLATGNYSKLFCMLMVSLIPTAIVALLTRDLAFALNQMAFIPAIFIIITGVMLYLVSTLENGDVNPMEASYFAAFVIGGVQGLAVFPGLSRCALVLSMCLLFHFDRKFTYKFTFLTAFFALIGAIIVDFIDLFGSEVKDIKWLFCYILAGGLAFCFGYVGLLIVKKSIYKGKFLAYSIYCLVVGAVALAAMVVIN